MGFMDSINKKEFVTLCEINTPKGVDTRGLYEVTNLLKGRADALMITDMPSAVMRMGSLSASYLLKERGFDTIYNITCRDRNLLAIQSDILGASALGIENIYITNGDDITMGDHPRSKPVMEVDDSMLLSLLKRLQEGYDTSGNELEGAPKFNTGAYINSNARVHALEHELGKMEEKIKQEVAFFITPAIFDLKSFEEFISKIKPYNRAPVIAEVILLKSVATARFINRHVENVSVPDEVIDRLHSAGDKLAESIAITGELIKGLKKLCSGVHIVSLGWESKLPLFLDAAEI